jgi:hypothetical protein
MNKHYCYWADKKASKLHQNLSVISDFRHDVDEMCTLLAYYAASNGKYLLMFQDNISVPSSRVKMSTEA